MSRHSEHPVDLLSPSLLKLGFFLQILTCVGDIELNSDEITGFWFWLNDLREELQELMTVLEEQAKPAA